MKRQSLFFLIFCLLTTMVYGQTTLTTSPKTLPASKITQLNAQLGINHYRALDFDASALISQASNGASSLNFTLSIGPTSFPIAVTRNDNLLSGDFTVISSQHGQTTDITSNIMLVNYRGTLQNDPSVPVSVSVSNVGISMTLGLPTGDMVFTPSFVPLLGQYETDEYIFHEVPDYPNSATCDLGLGFASNDCVSDGASINDGTIMETNCPRVIEIAADVDALFMDNFPQGFFGDILATFIVFVVVESSELVYENNFNMEFELTSIRLFTGVDPYPNISLIPDGNRTALLNAIAAAYAGISQTVIPRDMVMLFTGNQCVSENGNITVMGQASGIPDMCNASSAVYVTECMFEAGIFQYVITHEVGHLLGAIHTEFTGCSADCNLGVGNNSLMCSGGSPAGDPLFMDACNIATVNNFLNTSASCLNNDGEITGPSLLCQGQSSGYFFISTNFSSENLTWTTGPGLTVTTTVGNAIAVTASNTFTGRSWVRATVEDGGCDPVFLRYINIGGGAAATCPMVYRLCPGTENDAFNMETANGSTISNINCISLNCNDINWSTSGSGSKRKFSISQGEPGFYFFTYSVTNSCGTNNYTFTVQVLPPSICNGPIKKTTVQEDLKALALEVVPNPNNGSFTLQYDLPNQSQPQITILNMQGQQVYELPQTGWKDSGRYAAEMKVANLPSGIYLVQLRTAVGQKTIRMRIQQ